MANVADSSYYDGQASGARKALREAAEQFERKSDETLTGAEVAQILRDQADRK